jgi:hypothetical protein
MTVLYIRLIYVGHGGPVFGSSGEAAESRAGPGEAPVLETKIESEADIVKML